MMIDTHCLDRIHHHHHYHERKQQKQPQQQKQVPARKSGELARTFASNLGSMSQYCASTRRGAAKQSSSSNMSRNSIVEVQSESHHHHNHHHSPISTLSLLENNSSSTIRARNTSSKISMPRRGRALRSSSSSSSSSSRRLEFYAILTLTFAVSLILLTLAREAHSLNCYTCSSADDPGCDEPFTGRANYSSAEATDCSKYIDRPAKVCRKIVQYIEEKKVVLRSCGWIDERQEEKKQAASAAAAAAQGSGSQAAASSAASSNPLVGPDGKRLPMCHKRSGTFALMMESCVCYEDLCNHSASLVPDQSVLSLTLFALASILCLLLPGSQPT